MNRTLLLAATATILLGLTAYGQERSPEGTPHGTAVAFSIRNSFPAAAKPRQTGAMDALGYDPFVGFYQFAGPSNQLLSSYSVSKPGSNEEWRSPWRGHFFAGVGYHHTFLNNGSPVDVMPVTIGFRW
jgi:hypothetical protein